MTSNNLLRRSIDLAVACQLLTVAVCAQATVTGASVIELPGGMPFDSFGRQVLVDGDELVITANGVDAMGAAYAYREVAGQWTEEQKFRGSDTAQGDFFGFAADRDGDVLVMGAHQHDQPVVRAGAAYVFERQAGDWVEVAKLSAPGADAFDTFGYSVAMHADLIVVGATGDDDGGNSAGAAYVFRNTSGGWAFEQKLLASTGDGADQFGWEVDTDGSSIAVAAISDEVGPAEAGAVFVFEHNGQAWQESQRLVAADGMDQDRFGWDLALEGDTLVVSATDHDHPLVDGGAVYVFDRTAGTWGLAQELVPSKLGPYDSFGWSLALEGTTLAVGAGGSSSAYSFHHNGSEWVEVLQCKDPVLVGGSCSTDGPTLVGGNPWSKALQGSVYVFETSDLGLDALPDSVPLAGSLELETYGGLAGASAGLYTLTVGGLPLVRRVGTGSFDPNGKDVLTITAPSSLSGLDVTLVAVGFWAAGSVGLSNVVTIQFQ